MISAVPAVVGLLAIGISVVLICRSLTVAGAAICSCHNPVRWWIYKRLGIS